jgi:hypothetical protein
MLSIVEAFLDFSVITNYVWLGFANLTAEEKRYDKY